VGRHKRHHDRVRPGLVLQPLISLDVVRSRRLLSSAEKLQWPTPIDYTTVRSEDRKTFESAFLNLVTVQSLQVLTLTNARIV
jgi:hypothetical protein